MQYSTGTISISSGTTTVTGVGTAFTDYVQAGDLFQKSGENVLYAIASVTDDTHLELASNYPDALSGASYIITVDFTPNYDLPLVKVGDREWPSLFEKAMTIIDTTMQDFEDRITVLEP
jgi:hypothetical protein